jgi:hypothetical protein
VIQNKTLDLQEKESIVLKLFNRISVVPYQGSVRLGFVDHLENFNHKQINGSVGALNGADGIHDLFGQWICQFACNLGAQRSASNTDEHLTVHNVLGYLNFVQKLLSAPVQIEQSMTIQVSLENNIL